MAEGVGIRKASVHHHFATKADLSLALMQRYCADMAAACAEIEAAEATGAGRISALIALYREALDEGRSLCLCVSFSTSQESLSQEVVAEIASFRSMMVGWLAAAFARGMADRSIDGVADPGAEAAATLPLLEGAQLAARSAVDLDVFDAGFVLLKARLS
mgnify:CR=1 FL=1